MGSICTKPTSLWGTVDTVHASPEVLWCTILDIESCPSYLSCVQSVTNITWDDKRIQSCNSTKNHQETIRNIIHPNKKNCATNNKNKTNMNNKNGQLIKDGTSWDEHRIVYGKDVFLRKQVTSIWTTEHDVLVVPTMEETNNNNNNNNISVPETATGKVERHEQKNFRVSIVFPKAKRYSKAVNTCTLIVDSLITSASSASSPTSSPSPVTTPVTTPVPTPVTTPVETAPTTCQLIGTLAFLPSNLFEQFYLLIGGSNKYQELFQCELNEISIEAERRQQQLLQQQLQQQLQLQ